MPQPGHAGPIERLRFVLAGIRNAGVQEQRVFRVEAAGRTIGVLTVTCARGAMTGAAYQAGADPIDRAAAVAEAAGPRLCQAVELRLTH